MIAAWGWAFGSITMRLRAWGTVVPRGKGNDIGITTVTGLQMLAGAWIARWAFAMLATIVAANLGLASVRRALRATTVRLGVRAALVMGIHIAGLLHRAIWWALGAKALSAAHAMMMLVVTPALALGIC